MSAIDQAYKPGTATVLPETIISILSGAATIFLRTQAVVTIDEDAQDAAIIAQRRGEPTEPLDSVLSELGLNE